MNPSAANQSSVTDREIRIGEIVLHAAGLDTADQDAYLRETTGEHPELLAEVRRRLSDAADLPSSFLAGSAQSEGFTLSERRSGAPQRPAMPTGDERYQLEERLGSGGMAEVWRVHDRQLGRDVALKFLSHDDPELLERFLREARSQARIRHDNVLDVYETGDLDGRAYIAMRYVAGPTLLEVRETTSLEQKLRLLVRVCEGLHAAHREGLIHRDVKPSNVFVEETPEGELKPYVGDFGIVSDPKQAGMTTTTGTLLGTPLYMAPERIRDEASVDRRSDVFSLGVTMYHLFTGTLPFADELPVLALKRIVEEEPRPLRELVPSLPSELEAIVLKCLEKDPERRYSSMRAVAEDLKRYLDGEVVEAHAATLAYRVTKLVMRHKLLVGLGGVAAVALIIALLAVSIFGALAIKANKKAELRQGQAEELISFLLVDLKKKLDPLVRLDVLDDVSDEAMEYFRAVPFAELSDDELGRYSMALYQIGEIRIQQGDLPSALEPLTASLTLARELTEREPAGGERLFGLGQSHFWVGFVLWRQNDFAGAREHLEAYLGVSRRLVTMDPENMDWLLELSYAHSNLGSLLQAEGDLEGALRQFQVTYSIDRKLVESDSSRQDWQFELAATHNTLGVVLRSLGRLAEARDHFQSDIDIRQALVESNPDNTRWREFLGTSHDFMAGLLQLQGDLPSALDHLQKARGILESLVALDPARTPWWRSLAMTHSNIGRVQQDLGRTDRARASWQSQLEIMEDLHRRDPTNHLWRRDLATAHYGVGVAEAEGDVATAQAEFLQAVDLLESLVNDQPEDREALRILSDSYTRLGSIVHTAGNDHEASRAWHHAVELIEPIARGSQDPYILATWARPLLHLGRRDAARPIVDRLRTLGFRESEFLALCRSEGLACEQESPIP